MLSENHKKSLYKRGALMFMLVPLFLGGMATASDYFAWDVVDSARCAALLVMLTLAVFILSPLYKPFNDEERYLGFIYYWLIVSTIFNVSWQIPLIVFRDTITTAELTHENLYKFISWWAYGFADTHYGKVSDWMISEEIWWFLAIVISVIGLWKIEKGNSLAGFILVGVGELFKFYNASLYMVYDTVTGFKNIPIPDWISWTLYWGFNPLWAGCALLAGILCLRMVYTSAANK